VANIGLDAKLADDFVGHLLALLFSRSVAGNCWDRSIIGNWPFAAIQMDQTPLPH